MIESVKTIKIKGNEKEIVDDLIIEEVPLTLNVNDKELVTLLCTPIDLDDLVRGFLFTSGLIKRSEDLKKIVIDQQQWVAYIDLVDAHIMNDLIFKRLYTSGCGRGTLFYSVQDMVKRSKVVSDLKIETIKINALMLDFQKKSALYLKTGGAHSAAMTDDKEILVFKEDIGRHNAIDKVIGQALKENISFENKIMITSGRISSEVLFKIQKCDIPIIISKSAPTNQGVKLAKDMGITLIGFARGNRMNIYSQDERVV
jgi:FdhD protein